MILITHERTKISMLDRDVSDTLLTQFASIISLTLLAHSDIKK